MPARPPPWCLHPFVGLRAIHTTSENVCTVAPVKRVNVHLDEELDAELAREAARTGESKASLLRRAARAFLDRQAAGTQDSAWAEFTGAVTDAEPDERHHDDVIYR